MKKNNTPDNLTLCATAAINAGMSYGKYMAKYGWNPPIMRPEPEPEDYENDIITCPECGKRFRRTGKHLVYCCFECYRTFHARAAKQRYHDRKESQNELEIRSR